jgi:uncharacterized protein (TIGR04255 family)
LRIDSEPPAGFQEDVRGEYPLLQDSPVALAGLQGLPAEITKVISSDIPIIGANKIYQFISADQIWTLGLTREFLSLSTRRYEHWKDFKSRMQAAFSSLVRHYSPAFFVRIGLRYRDVIRRSALDLTDVPWTELLHPHMLGELASAEVAQDIQHAAREVIILLQDPGTKVRVRHGLARTGGNGEVCYVIDSDFFREERTEINDAFNLLDSFNRQAGRLFRWYITGRLHDAMQPRIVE